MNQHNKTPQSRRAVLFAAASGLLAMLTNGSAARAERRSLPRLAGSDVLAHQMGYVEDARAVDSKANPTYKAGSSCSNCVLLRGKPDEEWRECILYPGRLVNPGGWCRGWVRNPRLASTL